MDGVKRGVTNHRLRDESSTERERVEKLRFWRRKSVVLRTILGQIKIVININIIITIVVVVVVVIVEFLTSQI